MPRRLPAVWCAAHAPLLLGAIGCATDFDPPSQVRGVRILATRADRPYAPPGARVQLEVLAVDGRATPEPRLEVAWFPEPCINPERDAYFACYPSLRASVDGVELATRLVRGSAFSFEMPADVLVRHAEQTGRAEHGVAYAFVVACAGRMALTPDDPERGPNALPVGCFDAGGNAVGADDFVFGFATIYAFEALTNDNPSITAVTLRGVPVDAATGIELDRCTESDIDDCPGATLATLVPDAAQEPDPSGSIASGKPLREEVWVDYYVTAGKLERDTLVLFDPRAGRLDASGNDLKAPHRPGNYRFWAVARDNRGGLNWIEMPLIIR